MRELCPFPLCVLDDWHDGDHAFAGNTPYGALQLVYQFQVLGSVMCDLCPELPAKAFYQDGQKKGWALCSFCQDEYLGRESMVA